MDDAYHVVFLSQHEVIPRPELERVLSPVGARLIHAKANSEEQATATCRDADGVINQGRSYFSGRVLHQLPRCRIIVSTGVGVDKYDIDTATELGILICNNPGSNAREVADHTLGLLLVTTRKIVQINNFVKTGAWSRDRNAVNAIRAPVHRLEGQTLGIIGLGSVGRRVAQRAQAFGLRVIAYDPYIPAETAAAIGVEFVVDRDELFRRSHIVTIHAPLTAETQGSVGARELLLMPRGSYLLNAARGPIVDQDALIEALRRGHLEAAGLDVTEPEPLPEDSPLVRMDNVIITAHSAGSSEETSLESCVESARSVAEVLQGRVPSVALNPDAFRPPAGVR